MLLGLLQLLRSALRWGRVVVCVLKFCCCFAAAFVYDQVVFVCLALYLAAESYGRVVCAVSTTATLSMRCLFVGCHCICQCM